jgi:hypothetical protein
MVPKSISESSRTLATNFVDEYSLDFRKPDRKVSSRLSDYSLVALHPIFVDFANLRVDPTLIVG